MRLPTGVGFGLAWWREMLALGLMALAAGSVPQAGAATIISGGFLTTQSWGPGGSPYIVVGDAAVANGQTLTIYAGTSVLFASTDAGNLGIDPARVELLIQGSLLVQGTNGDPVTFGAQSGGTTSSVWYGILFLSTATGSFAHGDVRNAAVGLLLGASGVEVESSAFSSNGFGIGITNGSPHVRNSVFTSNSIGIRSSGGNPFLEAVTASNNGDGIVLTGASGGTVLNSVVSSNTGAGIVLSPSTASTTYITHSTIHGNGGYGIHGNASNASAQRLVRNCLVTMNSYGFRRESTDTAALSVTYSDVWGNPQGDYDGVGPGEGTISADPLYVGPPANLRLSPTSPAIDSAEDLGVLGDRDGTARPLDGDGIGGAQPDMGAYERSDVIFADGFEATS